MGLNMLKNEGNHICCCSRCWVGIIAGGAIPWLTPIPVAGMRIEAAVIWVMAVCM